MLALDLAEFAIFIKLAGKILSMLSSFIKRLLFAGGFVMREGRIQILDKRHLLLPVSFFLAMHHKEEYANFKKSMKKELRHYIILLKDSNLGPQKAMVKILETLGMGRFEIVDVNYKKKEAMVVVYDCSIAVEAGKQEEPVCYFVAGAIAAMFSILFKKDVDCKEKRCRSEGHEHCEFVVK